MAQTEAELESVFIAMTFGCLLAPLNALDADVKCFLGLQPPTGFLLLPGYQGTIRLGFFFAVLRWCFHRGPYGPELWRRCRSVNFDELVTTCHELCQRNASGWTSKVRLWRFRRPA